LTFVGTAAKATTEIEAMYGLIGKMTAAAGQRQALIAILLEGIEDMPGCRSYIVAEDAGNADDIWITEVWDSKESHAASLKLPSVRDAITRAMPLIAAFGQGTTTVPVGGTGLGSGKLG
jgi:quinol monooxygenase YgiN